MLINKEYKTSCILATIISIITYFSLNNIIVNLPDRIYKEETLFYLYRNSIIWDGALYILIPIFIYLFINISNKYLNIYSMLRYENKDCIIKNILKNTFKSYILFFSILNIFFIIYILLKFNLDFFNFLFIKYLLISYLCQILGCFLVMLIIFLINFFIKKIILSSFIVFGSITLFKAIIRMLKSTILTLDNIIFYKSDFFNYPTQIIEHIKYLVYFIFLSYLMYILILIIFKRTDNLNG